MLNVVKNWWPYLSATAVAAWAVFTYLHPAPKEGAAAASAPAAIARPAAPASETAAVKAPPTSVTATGGIAIGGNVTDSDLHVDAPKLDAPKK